MRLRLDSDVAQLGDCLAAVSEDARAGRSGLADVAGLIRDARRVVVTGNGAALYAASALCTAALANPHHRVEVVMVPAGALAAGRLRWREGDRPLVVSSSGELRDVVSLLDAAGPTRLPRPYAAVTAKPHSRLGREAEATAVVPVIEQRAVTHTQAFVGNVLTLLMLWEHVVEADLDLQADELPRLTIEGVAASRAWAQGLDLPNIPVAAMTFGSGGGWPAALEAALLLKEVSGIPAEGLETREGATSGMYALNADHLVVSVPTVGDPHLAETEAVCRGRGARVLRLPSPTTRSDLVAPITCFPAAIELSARLGEASGHDVDEPAWTAAYYATARRRDGDGIHDTNDPNETGDGNDTKTEER